MLILVDSGSSHSFVSASFLSKCGIKPQPMTPQVVKLANGETMTTDKMVPNLSWWIQGHTISADMKVLDLGAFDAILGYDWLTLHSPMNCHWENRTLEFNWKGTSILLQGILPKDVPPKELSVAQLYKWYAGNDISALAVIEKLPDPLPQSVPLEVQSLLQQYEDVFEDPQTLPPSRLQDHHIPLLPNTAPVNARPYRYSPLEKDEIERQVKELLTKGLIVPNNSPFASPVLLVQKKDGTWRFCIDYRKLNDLTVKNRFPMPLVDEIIDELAGTRFFTKLDMRSGYHQGRM